MLINHYITRKEHNYEIVVLMGHFAFNQTGTHTLVKTSMICTGQYTFQILLLNDDNMLGEHKGREKNIVYGSLF